MKKIIPTLVLCLTLFCFLLTGCTKGVSGGPNQDDAIFGNGGSVVTVGDYAFYAKGFEDADSESTGVSYIYRAKNVDGEYKEETQIVSKIAGYKNGSLYAFDGYLYFACPNTLKDDTGTARTDLITFYRVNYDGTGLKQIYRTDEYSSGSYSYAKLGEKLYLVVFDGSKLVKVDLSSKKFDVTTLAESATAAVLSADKSTYGKTEQSFRTTSDYVYYTRAREEIEGSESGVTGNVLMRVSISNGEKKIISSNAGETITLTSYKDERVVFSIDSMFYSDDFSSNSSRKQHTFTAVTDFINLGKDEDNNEMGFVYTYNSKLFYIAYGTIDVSSSALVNASVTVLFYNNDYVYYLEGNTISRVSVSTKEIQTVAKDCGTIETGMTPSVDYDENFVYFMSLVEPEEDEETEEAAQKLLYKADLSILVNVDAVEVTLFCPVEE